MARAHCVVHTSSPVINVALFRCAGMPSTNFPWIYQISPLPKNPPSIWLLNARIRLYECCKYEQVHFVIPYPTREPLAPTLVTSQTVQKSTGLGSKGDAQQWKGTGDDLKDVAPACDMFIHHASCRRDAAMTFRDSSVTARKPAVAPRHVSAKLMALPQRHI